MTTAMNWHPTEEDLVLHFYGEGGADTEGRVQAHLDACQACRGAWVELGDTMALVDAAGVPEPAAGFEEAMWARVQPALPERRATIIGFTRVGASGPRSLWSRPLVTAGALAAAVLAMVAAGQFWPAAAPAGAPPAAVAANADVMRERVLLTAMGDHLEQSEMLLVELMNGTGGGASLDDYERDAAETLVDSGRLYRASATESGRMRLADMLDDLERVLVEIAAGPDRKRPGDLDALRARIDDADLIFKVRVVTNEIRQRQRVLASVTE